MLRIAVLPALLATLTACSSSDPAFGGGGRQATREQVSYPAIRFETSAGAFTAILYPEAAPETVARYQEYAESGYYVGRSFDRVVPGFVIQATDCLVSVLTRDSRTLPLEPSEDHFFSAGALGIARAADPDSGGSEFFVMDFPTSHLRGEYTVWGQVIEGIEVIRHAARVQAIDFTAGGQVPAVLGDRCALQPVEISATQNLTVTLDADQAARLPMRVAERVRTDTVAYNLEWPASLAAGRATELSAYINHLDGSAPPPADELSISVGGAPVEVEGDPGTAGIYRFDWTPPAPGDYDVVLEAGGAELAVLVVNVER